MNRKSFYQIALLTSAFVFLMTNYQNCSRSNFSDNSTPGLGPVGSATTPSGTNNVTPQQLNALSSSWYVESLHNGEQILTRGNTDMAFHFLASDTNSVAIDMLPIKENICTGEDGIAGSWAVSDPVLGAANTAEATAGWNGQAPTKIGPYACTDVLQPAPDPNHLTVNMLNETFSKINHIRFFIDQILLLSSDEAVTFVLKPMGLSQDLTSLVQNNFLNIALRMDSYVKDLETPAAPTDGSLHKLVLENPVTTIIDKNLSAQIVITSFADGVAVVRAQYACKAWDATIHLNQMNDSHSLQVTAVEQKITNYPCKNTLVFNQEQIAAIEGVLIKIDEIDFNLGHPPVIPSSVTIYNKLGESLKLVLKSGVKQ